MNRPSCSNRVSSQVWDQKFMEHHLIAIAGYATSELANVFGLANAVNTWITEAIGGKVGIVGDLRPKLTASCPQWLEYYLSYWVLVPFQGLCLLVLRGFSLPNLEGVWDPKITLEVCCETRQWNNPNSRRASVICPLYFFGMFRIWIPSTGKFGFLALKPESVAKRTGAREFPCFPLVIQKMRIPSWETNGRGDRGGRCDRWVPWCILLIWSNDRILCTWHLFLGSKEIMANQPLLSLFWPVMKPFRKTEEGNTLGGLIGWSAIIYNILEEICLNGLLMKATVHCCSTFVDVLDSFFWGLKQIPLQRVGPGFLSGRHLCLGVCANHEMTSRHVTGTPPPKKWLNWNLQKWPLFFSWEKDNIIDNHGTLGIFKHFCTGSFFWRCITLTNEISRSNRDLDKKIPFGVRCHGTVMKFFFRNSFRWFVTPWVACTLAIGAWWFWARRNAKKKTWGNWRCWNVMFVF